MTQPKSRGEQLADAYEAVATADHYMVGIVETVSDAELDEAFGILVDRQNATDPEQYPEQFAVYDLALTLIEQAQGR